MDVTQITCARDGTLSSKGAAVPADRPVVILLHGYKYQPGAGLACPHTSLYSPTSDHPAERSRNWPHRLHLADSGLSAIGFGWSARGSVWSAWRAANLAGKGLARLIADLNAKTPAREVHILAHSMGARVALTALRTVEPRLVSRVILLNAADFVSHADIAMQRQGRTVSLFNVTSRENAVFDALIEMCLADTWFGGHALGRGYDTAASVTPRLDRADHLDALSRLGHALPTAARRVCHWSTYLRPGTGALYRAILDGSLDFAKMKATLAASERDARTSGMQAFA